MTELTPERFDAMMTTTPRAKRERPVWTLPAIGNLIGAGPDMVRSLAKEPGSPIHCVQGRWFCYESELIAWMRNPSKPS